MNDGAGRFLMLVVAAMALVLPNQKAASDLQPTNRLSLTATEAEVFTVPLVSGSRTSPIALLRDSMNLTARADLVIRVAAECGLYTDVVGIGHVSSASSANVDVWLEVDGRPVTAGSVSENDGDVVFADQEFALSPSQFDDPGATATIFEKTRSRHAYNW